jgi:periplasmic protein TonB
MKGVGALRWPLGGFLVASALAHAAFFGLPLDLTSGSRSGQGPVVVSLLPGPAAAGPMSQRQPPPRPVATPRHPAKHAATRRREVMPKPLPKLKPEPKPRLKLAEKTPLRPAPAPLAQQPPSPAAEELPAAVVSPVPDAASPAGRAQESAAVAVAAAGPPPPPAGSAGAIPGEAPLAADFGSANGPRILQLEQPVYPPRALRLRREGEVLLRLEIDSSGHLQSATVVESAGYGFDASALDAVRRARFAPASRGGLPVPCVALLPVSFTLATRP